MNNNQKEFSVSTLIFRELPLEKALELLSTTGFKWIDLTIVPNFCPHYDLDNTTQEDDKILAALIEQYGFKVSSLNISPGYYNIHEPEEIDRRLIRAGQVAKQLGSKIITIPSGAKVDPVVWEETARSVVKHLTRISAVLEKEYGVCLSLETPHLKTLTETMEESVRFHDMLDCDSIRCTIDTSHVAAQSLNGVAESLAMLKKTNHIHLRDARNQDISYTPGKGDVDYRAFFDKMNQTGYTGKLVFELEYHDFPIEKKISELQFAWEYCRYLINKEKLPYKLKIETNFLYMVLEGLLFDPVSEIKRHQKFFMWLRQYKKWLFALIPEKIFQGVWVRRYRFNKNKRVTHKPGSVIVVENPEQIIKVGVVGLGYAGNMHASGFERLNNCRVVGGFDTSEEAREKFSNKYNCKTYNSLESMIEKERPDIVSVCTREWLHHEAVMYCLKNQVNVFCEKLLATRIEHATEMVQTAQENNLTLGVNYNYRFIPAIQKIKELIEVQALGKLAYFVINVHAFSYAHALDILSFFGGTIKSVAALNQNDPEQRVFAGTDWSQYDDDIQYIPSTGINVMVEFENGGTGVVNSSIHYPLHSYIMSVEAVFEQGVVNFSGMNMFSIKGKLTWFSKKSITAVDMNYLKNMYATGYELSFYNSVEDFVRCYVNGKNVETDGKMGLLNMELEKHISRSVKNIEKIDFQNA